MKCHVNNQNPLSSTSADQSTFLSRLKGGVEEEEQEEKGKFPGERKKWKRQDRGTTATPRFVLHAFRDTCSVRSLSSPMSSMAKRTSSFRGSICLSSFSCWHSAINCDIKKRQAIKAPVIHAGMAGHLLGTSCSVPQAWDIFGLRQSLSKKVLGPQLPADKIPVSLRSFGMAKMV